MQINWRWKEVPEFEIEASGSPQWFCPAGAPPPGISLAARSRRGVNGVAVDLAQSGAVAEKMQSIYEIGRRAVHRGAIQAGAGIEGPEQRLPIRNWVVCREVRLPLGIEPRQHLQRGPVAH